MMDQMELQWDKLLKIKTTGRDDSHSDQYRYPYEPTPYCVLERLANSGLIGKKNVVLERAVYAFSCLIRRDAGPLELNTRKESFPGRRRIGIMQSLPEELLL